MYSQEIGTYGDFGRIFGKKILGLDFAAGLDG